MIKTKPDEFKKFNNTLMGNSQRVFIPWYFPCKRNGKDPDPGAILNIDPTSKGSWHHPSARLTVEQAVQLLKRGYNIGISARKGDPLIIIDIDNQKYLDQLPKETLTVISRKRSGCHAFCAF